MTDLPWEPGPDYCWSCNRDEPLTGNDYLICGECFHVYYTRLNLWFSYLATMWGLDKATFKRPLIRSTEFVTSWWELACLSFVRPSRIYVCPKCAHDF